jgi:hypothetical protein
MREPYCKAFEGRSIGTEANQHFMNLVRLFISTCEELDAVANGASEFRTLRAAGLLRLLLLDDHNLVSKVQSALQTKFKLTFEIVVGPDADEAFRAIGVKPGPTIKTMAWRAIFPGDTLPGAPRTELKLDQFLKHPVFQHGAEQVTVKQIIKFLANAEGGVHHTSNLPAEQAALRELNDAIRVGDLGAISSYVRGLSNVVLSTLRSVVNEIRRRLEPARANAMRRVTVLGVERDPRDYDPRTLGTVAFTPIRPPFNRGPHRFQPKSGAFVSGDDPRMIARNMTDGRLRVRPPSHDVLVPIVEAGKFVTVDEFMVYRHLDDPRSSLWKYDEDDACLQHLFWNDKTVVLETARQPTAGLDLSAVPDDVLGVLLMGQTLSGPFLVFRYVDDEGKVRLLTGQTHAAA